MVELTSWVDARGARLAVYQEGAGPDAVVLLHGGPGVPDYLEGVATILASGHRVIRYDQRGVGQSECTSGRYALVDCVEDLEAVRRATGHERLSLFGHSWGGMVAQLYATHYPQHVAKLCLCNSSIGLGDDWAAMERAVMAFNRRQGGVGGFAVLGLNQVLALLPGSVGDGGARRMMARAWRNYFDPPSSAPPPSPAWLAGIHSRPIFATRRAALAAKATDIRSVAAAPVLIIFGEHDIYGDTTERLVARYPGARHVVIPGAGHVPWLQNRSAFVGLICAFFDAERAPE